MKVLYVNHVAGVPIYRQLFEEIGKHKDIELYVLAPQNWEYEFEIKKKNASGKNFNLMLENAVFTPHLYRFFYFPPLFLKILKIKPDVIYINEEPGSFVALQAALWAKLAGSRVLFNTCENICRFGRFPLPIIGNWVMKNSKMATVVNRECITVLRKKGFKKKVEIIYLGYNPNIFYKKDVSGLKKKLGISQFTIGYMGRLLPEKGVDLILRAAAKLEFDYKILIDELGSKEYKEGLIRLAKELGIADRIIFVNPKYSEMPDYINCLDVLVLPSLTTEGWKEQFGRVLVEAMACGVPVIGSSSGSIPEVIGDAGLIFGEGNEKDLRKKIEAVGKDKKLRDLLIKKGLKRAERFQWKRIALDTITVLKNVPK